MPGRLREPTGSTPYSLRRTGARLRQVGFDRVLIQAFKLAGTLRLRSLDLLHVTTAKTMGANAIATLDKDIIRRVEEVRAIGLQVLTP